MGCSSSKRIEAAIDVYRPPPTSFAVFDINAIEEPWMKALEAHQQQQQSDHPDEKEKPAHTVPPPLLEKLNAIEDAPRSWDEVSKALNDLKPTLHNNPTPPPTHPKPILLLAAPKTPLLRSPSPPTPAPAPNEKENAPRKSFSFHTLEELDAKLSSKSKPAADDDQLMPKKTSAPATKPAVELKKRESGKHQSSEPAKPEAPAGYNYKPVKENIFILRDKLEREKEGKVPNIARFNPLNDFPEMCPPGGEESVVIYTTSLGGVRRTFEDCNKVRLIMESHRFVFDERDVSLHGEFLKELRELLGEGVSVPRMFVKGRYVGGVDEVVNLNETGRLGRILNWARVERGVGRLGCEGCGGARFVPCLDCGGSCKVLVGDDKKEKERCPSCNENGLVLCPACA
ncbi:protein lap4 [Coffea eugenioides]|uniref:protein lap4 n=1 Tax=Coffea eugenioides TaxID=49369 RepID=UPI000F613A1E|nr:protein lap4 [Coffea eugenioides]